MVDDDFDIDGLEILQQLQKSTEPAKPKGLVAPPEDDASPDEYMGSLGIGTNRSVPDITRPWMKNHKFLLVKSADELDAIIDAAIAAKKCALDLETEGLDNRIFYDPTGKPYTKHKIVGFCLSYDGVVGFYAPIRHNPEDGGTTLNLPVDRVEAAITRLCVAAQPTPKPGALEKDPLSFKDHDPGKLVLYFWNAKFDQEFLYPVTGIDWWHPESFEDGNLSYYVNYTDDKQLSLKWKAFNELKDAESNPYEMIELKDLFVRGREIKFALLSPDEPGCVKYACSDAICTYLLCDRPRKHEKRTDVIGIVREKHSFIIRLEKQTAQAMRWMERPRVRVNRDLVHVHLEENAKKRDEIIGRIKKIAEARQFHGFDPKSTKVLSEFLFTDKGLNITPKPDINEKSGQYKTDAESLEKLVAENPGVPDVLKWIVEWRGYEKLDSTYLQSMYNNVDDNSEMRFQFKQTGAATGRFSAPAGDNDQGFSGIPVHGIPGTSALRTCFEAREGFTLVKSDYAGEELRIAANVSGEMVWIREFLEGEGDLHSITARAFFGKQDISKDERKMGKIANFALLYGGGPQAIMRATGCDKLEASRRKAAFDKAVPSFAQWIKAQHAFVKKHKGVYTAFGRWIAIPDIDSPEKMVIAACERKSTNFPIQGAGADVMKISLVLLCKEFYKRGWLKQGGGDDSVRMLLSVHDEIVFEIKHARVQEALVVITKVMASPTYMAGPPHSGKWRVPLIVEPLIGKNWAGEYDYGMLTHGRKHKEGEKLKAIEHVIGDKVYHKVPPWLEGLFKPGWETAGHESPKDGGDSSGGGSEAAAPVVAPTPVADAPTVELAPASVAAVVEQPKAAPPATKTIKKDDVASTSVVTFKISILSAQTVKQVRSACADAYDPDNGKILCLVDAMGHLLVDPSLQIKVVPEEFAKILKERNLSDGVAHPYVRP